MKRVKSRVEAELLPPGNLIVNFASSIKSVTPCEAA